MSHETTLVFIGAFFGALLMGLSLTTYYSSGKAECEKHLPRVEECVLQWAPPSPSAR